MNERMPKVNELVRHHLSVIVHRFFNDEIVSITKVEVTKDLEYAKIWLAAVSDVDSCVSRCNQNSKQLQRELAEKLILRKTPKLAFVSDKTSESVNRIEQLLSQIKKEK